MNMSWKLASADHSLALDLDVGDGPLNGTLTFDGKVFTVFGSWAASGVDGRTASAFGVSGQTTADPLVYVAATGIMTGQNAPTQINILVDASSSADGTINHYEGVLLPA
jgi:hypothetical protein